MIQPNIQVILVAFIVEVRYRQLDQNLPQFIAKINFKIEGYKMIEVEGNTCGPYINEQIGSHYPINYFKWLDLAARASVMWQFQYIYIYTYFVRLKSKV